MNHEGVGEQKQVEVQGHAYRCGTWWTRWVENGAKPRARFNLGTEISGRPTSFPSRAKNRSVRVMRGQKVGDFPIGQSCRATQFPPPTDDVILVRYAFPQPSRGWAKYRQNCYVERTKC